MNQIMLLTGKSDDKVALKISPELFALFFSQTARHTDGEVNSLTTNVWKR